MFKHSLHYLISNVANASVPFILLPFLTSSLTTAQYGIIGLFQIMVVNFSAIIGMGVSGSSSRYYFSSDNRSQAEYNFHCIFIIIVSFIILATGFYHFSDSIVKELPKQYVLVALISSFFTVLYQFYLTQLQVRKKSVDYLKVHILFSVSNVMTCLMLLSLYKHEWVRIYSILAVVSSFGLVVVFFSFREKLILVCRFKYYTFYDIIRFGIPLLPHVISLSYINSLDRYAINSFLGFGDVGIYTVAFQVCLALSILFDSFNKAYVPWLYEKLAKPDCSKKNIVKLTYIGFAILLSLGGVLYFSLPLVFSSLLSDDYSDAATVVGILSLAQVFGGMYLLVTNYIFYSKKTDYLSYASLLTLSFYYVMLYHSIEITSIIDVAYCFLLAKAIHFLLVWLFSMRAYKMPWFIKLC
ncbi:lipopolysaccharide biosynthesis protein [Vibrio sp. 1S139]|uniref:lipopolysaccharide biosynthesis protein n=1 Tax=Vibrio sp. 1S139 TaxID=3230006 RepID=UPI00352C54AD